MTDVLEKILAAKRLDIERLESVSLPTPPERRPLRLARQSGPLRLIAEIKRRSPSAGSLSTKLSPAERAARYEQAGASMVSVLCDEHFFDGSLAHLAEVRHACSLPLLCKEFVLHEVQVRAARAYGADAVLLIVRCVAPAELERLIRCAEDNDIVPFVEVSTELEARLALGAGARLIGVNARDLDTLAMDPARAARVLEALPDGVCKVHLSGLATPADVARVAATNVDAALVGETLMRQDDPSELLGRLRAAAG